LIFYRGKKENTIEYQIGVEALAANINVSMKNYY
jgi:hypothetical protein